MFLYIMNGFEEGRFIQLTRELTQIGRLSEGELNGIKNHEMIFYDDRVSRVHAQFKIKDGTLYIEDLKSTSGTYLNMEEIEGEASISPGDVISMGATLLLVCEENDKLPVLKASEVKLSS